LWHIGQIITFDRECLYLTHSFGVNSWTLNCKVCPQKSRNVTVLFGHKASWYTMYWTVLVCIISVTDELTDRQNYDSNSVHVTMHANKSYKKNNE